MLGIFVDGRAVDALTAGTTAAIVLDRTPFYAESGGQVGDRGELVADAARFAVEDTRKQGGLFLHLGRLAEGSLKRGDVIEARVEDPRREATRLNHSATHLLHAALRRVLGEHVEQKGSLVDDERLRFDFSHSQPVASDEIAEIERVVNREIRRNHAVEARVMSYPDAIDAGALALFGEKYGDEVRVLAMGDFSVELCGGTHVARTGDIGAFKIVSESGVASGVRRIEAITGEAAVAHAIESDARLARLAQLVRAGGGDIEAKIGQMFERTRGLEKENQELRNRLAGQSGRDIAAGATEIGGATVVAECLEGADMNTLRAACDRLKDRFERAVVVLAAVEDGKIRLVAGVTKSFSDTVHAGQLVNHVAQQIGGKGGGRPDMAQAGGNDVDRLDEALASVPVWVAERVH